MKKHHSYALLAICEGNPLVTSGFPSQKAQLCGGLMFLSCCQLENAVEQTVQLLMIWNTMMFMPRHCDGIGNDKFLSSSLSKIQQPFPFQCQAMIYNTYNANTYNFETLKPIKG